MLKRIFAVLFIFFIGAIGGLWSQAFLLPYIAANPEFKDMQFVKDWNSRTTIVNQTSEVIINQDEAVERGIETARNIVVGVRSTAGTAGSGLIVTSDGLIVTWASFVPAGFTATVLFENGESFPAQVIKRDLVNNLALLKIEKSGLHTTRFSDDVRIGNRVFLVGMLFEVNGVQATANEGIITVVNETIIQTNISERSILDGSSLFDIEGRVVGLTYMNREGKVSAISFNVLREFLGF